MKWTNRILNVIFSIIVIFFLLDSLTSFDIKSQMFKTFIYFGLLNWNTFDFNMEYLGFQDKKKKNYWICFPNINHDFHFNYWTGENYLLNRCLADKDNFI